MKNLNVRDFVLGIAVILTLCNTYFISGAKRTKPKRHNQNFSRSMECKKSGRGMERGREFSIKKRGKRPTHRSTAG